MRRTLLYILVLLLLCLNTGYAGWIETLDGSKINGTILSITDEHVRIQTVFAGTIRIPRRQVLHIESPNSFTVRTSKGEVYEGNLRSDMVGRIIIGNGGGSARVPFRSVSSVWRKGEPDPLVPSSKPVASEQLRSWKLQISLDLKGRTGNVDNFSNAISVRGTLEGQHDRWESYGTYKLTEVNGKTQTDEIIAGTRFTSFPQGMVGWFVREELERDPVERVELRSTTGAGASFRLIQKKNIRLEASAGLSYRYETYFRHSSNNFEGGSRDYPGLDFTAILAWDWFDRTRLNTKVNYLPSVENFGAYLLEQDSSLEFPLDTRSIWKLRLGVSNKYNSQPTGNLQSLDTEFYTRLVLSWE